MGFDRVCLLLQLGFDQIIPGQHAAEKIFALAVGFGGGHQVRVDGGGGATESCKSMLATSMPLREKLVLYCRDSRSCVIFAMGKTS